MWRILFPLKRGCGILNGLKPRNLKTGATVLLMMNAAHVFNFDANVSNETSLHFENPFTVHNEPQNCNSERSIVWEKNNEAMRDLIRTLNSCIEEICEQYQHCVMKEIEMTLTCMTMEHVEKNLDELVRYRDKADNLKSEFIKYSMLVERIGKIIYTYGHTMDSEEGSIQDVKSDYEHLKGLIHQKIEENHYWDSKLLDVDTENVLIGLNQ